MDVIAANTPKDFMLQFDVGTCLDAGADPIAWIKANPGRIKSIHCKDWAPGDGKVTKSYLARRFTLVEDFRRGRVERRRRVLFDRTRGQQISLAGNSGTMSCHLEEN